MTAERARSSRTPLLTARRSGARRGSDGALEQRDGEALERIGNGDDAVTRLEHLPGEDVTPSRRRGARQIDRGAPPHRASEGPLARLDEFRREPRRDGGDPRITVLSS